MSTVVREEIDIGGLKSSELSNQSAIIETEETIYMPQDSGYSGICEIIKGEQGEYYYGFKSQGFSIENKRALALLAIEAAAKVADPDWKKSMIGVELPESMGLNVTEMGLIYNVSTSTGIADPNTGKLFETSISMGLTTRFCGHAPNLLRKVGESISAAYHQYAAAHGMNDDFANVEKVLFKEKIKNTQNPRGFDVNEKYTTSARSYVTDSEMSGLDVRYLTYFSGWIPNAGYQKLCTIRDVLLSKSDYYFGEEAAKKSKVYEVTDEITGKVHRTESTLKNNAAHLLAYVGGYIAGYLRVQELMPELLSEDIEGKLRVLQYESELARYRMSDEIYTELGYVPAYKNYVSSMETMTCDEFSITDFRQNNDNFSYTQTE